jgi:hypothetical protein
MSAGTSNNGEWFSSWIVEDAGWYQDPDSRNPEVLRWWDGASWTQHRHPPGNASPLQLEVPSEPNVLERVMPPTAAGRTTTRSRRRWQQRERNQLAKAQTQGSAAQKPAVLRPTMRGLSKLGLSSGIAATVVVVLLALTTDDTSSLRAPLIAAPQGSVATGAQPGSAPVSNATQTPTTPTPTTPTPTTPTPTTPATTTTLNNPSASRNTEPPTAPSGAAGSDVAITSCSVDQSDGTLIDVSGTVTNHDIVTDDYTIVVTVLHGTVQVGEADEAEIGIPTGQTVTWQTTGQLSIANTSVSCQVGSVGRTPSS